MDIYLGIGTNLGQREENIRTCLHCLAQNVGEVIQCSSLYYSQPQEFDSTNDFLNVVVHMQTNLTPLELLVATQTIERQMGRTQKTVLRADGSLQHFDRIIDIDILYYADLQRTFYNAQGQPILILPHPRMAERDFVMLPLKEIFP